MAVAVIALGSNLADPRANVLRAIEALSTLGTVSKTSKLYDTKAWGVEAQPDFVNAAVLLETALSPRELLNALQGIESALGRVPSYRWGPRLIDLDIIMYDDLEIDEPGLTIPHPRYREREFVLAPLADLGVTAL